MNPLQRLRFLFRRDRLDREMDEEMRFHLEMQARENAEAGVPHKEAAHLARRQFGHMDDVKEKIRDRRSIDALEDLLRDFRLSYRSLRRTPLYAVFVTAILAISIGLTTAIVNVSRAVLLPKFPFPNADELVVLHERRASSAEGSYTNLEPDRFNSYIEHASSFSALGGEQMTRMNLVRRDQPYRCDVSLVSPDYFPLLGIRCAQGRLFLPSEHQPDDSGTVAVITHDTWARLFNRDPSILGTDVELGGQLRRIVGALPEDFVPPVSWISADIYIPSTLETESSRSGGHVNAIGRLKPGVSIEQADAELAAIADGMTGRSITTARRLVPWLISLRERSLANRAQPFQILVGAAGLLFLIGCSAVANLTLGRIAGRRKELGVHLALGGNRRQVCLLVWRETLYLSLIGTGLGVGLAWWTQRLLHPILPSGTPGADQLVRFDLRIAGIAALLGTITCLLAGLIPAWRFSRISLNDSLKEGTGSVGESRRLRGLRGALVVAQSASALVLLVGAGLLIQSVTRLQNVDVGFDPTQLVAITGLKRSISDSIEIDRVGPLVTDRFEMLPEVLHASLTTTMPGGGFSSGTVIQIPGRSDLEKIQSTVFSVSPDYFATLDLRLLFGRGFADLHPGDRPVVIIDELTAQRFFPDENPVGRSIIHGNTYLEIVGVTQRLLTNHPRNSRADPKVQIYRPHWQTSQDLPWLIVLLRLAAEPGPDFETRIRSIIYDIDPTMVVSVQRLEDIVAEWSKTERSTLTVLQVLSALAVTLAFAGVFSVTAYMVAQRRGELGLRMVLGATPGTIAAFVLKRGAVLGGLGIVLGIGLALGLTRFMTRLLYETAPHEPITYVVVAALLALATVLASYLPARRAAKIDPAITLRAE